MSEARDETAAAPFVLKDAGRGFAGRSSDIFGSLDVLEIKHINHEKNRKDTEDFACLKPDDNFDDFEDAPGSSTTKISEGVLQGKSDHKEHKDKGNVENDIDRDNKKGGYKGDRSRGGNGDREESDDSSVQVRTAQFKRPKGRGLGRRSGRNSRVPEHVKCPQNWTYYSLEDVKGSEMSNKANTQAALAFLDERRKLREKAEIEQMVCEEEDAFDVSSAACSKGLFSFAKRSKTMGSASNTSSNVKPDKDRTGSSTGSVELGMPDESIGTEGEEDVQTAMGETPVEPHPSITKEAVAESGFKSRKGIRRNIRSRDDDD